jgi:glycosyltransferase involved in cell wall biosynthesis
MKNIFMNTQVRNEINQISRSDDKLKVVWLCYFTNQLVQDNIQPLRKIDEFAPWISNIIPLFENNDQIELHIISQHKWISGYKCFKNNDVTYHFINAGIPCIGRHWPGFFRFDLWTNFYFSKIQFARIVRKINPNIIHLHGFENEFSDAITQFYKKYPVFITIQGFIHKSSSKSKIFRKRVQNELRIIKMFNHYGYRTKTMGEEIKALNNNAVLHWHSYPINVVEPLKTEKKFDLVFFARVCKDKGIDDLLRAVSIIKKVRPEISLCVIGGGKLDIWKEKTIELDISANVFWVGFLPSQKDVHNMASTARICVLPTYHDIIPGTIIESMFLKLPVVAYNVGSIHELNSKEKIISLVEKFDVDGLANTIITLLNDRKMQDELSEKGYNMIKSIYNTDNEEIIKNLLNAYSEVINDFAHGGDEFSRNSS